LAGQIEEAAAKKRGGRRPEESQEAPISNESIQQAVEQCLMMPKKEANSFLTVRFPPLSADIGSGLRSPIRRRSLPLALLAAGKAVVAFAPSCIAYQCDGN